MWGATIVPALFQFRLTMWLLAADKWAQTDCLAVIISVVAHLNLRIPCGGPLRWRRCRTGRKVKRPCREHSTMMEISFDSDFMPSRQYEEHEANYWPN
ncbi:MAG TPA: hypothetical protein DCG65_00220, partial [Hyphomonas atlantica]|nr:hypothetical protein [Hyphomonas atlantica]